MSKIFMPDTSLSEMGRFIANLQNAVVPRGLILQPLMSTSLKLFEARCKQYASRTALGSSNSTTSRKISRCEGQIVIRLLRKRIRDRKIEDSKSSRRRLSGSALNSHFSTNDPC